MFQDLLIAFLDEDDSLPSPDVTLGLEDEYEVSEPLGDPPGVETLLRDPSIAALVEAAENMEPVVT